jgi:hypothetical protein
MGYVLPEFKEIKTNEEMEEFLNSVGCFHDAILKEVHSLNSGYVDNDLAMRFGGFDLRVLVQRQYREMSAVELLLGNVIDMNITNSDDIYSSCGKVNTDIITGQKHIKLDLDGNQFRCKRLFWRDASEWMGIHSKFGEDFSIETLNGYEHLEDGWVICKECCEAWKPISKIIQCPKCFRDRISNGTNFRKDI